jgi:hypothetical protein
MNDKVSWYRQTWVWVVTLVVLCVALFIGGLMFVISVAMKSSDAYQQGVAIAQQDPAVLVELGEPVEPGFFATGSIKVSGPSGSADLAVPIAGTRAKGTLYIVAIKEAGRWTMRVLEVEVEGRHERIPLMNREAHP